MNTYKLIMLDNPILVSSEDIKTGDFCYNPRTKEFFNVPDENYVTGLNKNIDDFKIIAGIPELPSIDLSSLLEEDCKKIGWIDVEKLAALSSLIEEILPDAHYRGYKEGFKTAQSLNEMKFSLQDIAIAFEAGRTFEVSGRESLNQIEYLQSISQPKIFDIELEMENDYEEPVGDILRPKITNNSIKIIKLL